MSRRLRSTVCGALDCAETGRLFPCGWRCASHSPLGRLGLPPYPPGPGWPKIPPRAPDSYTQLNDDRAVATGKRRASAARYREARASVDR